MTCDNSDLRPAIRSQVAPSGRIRVTHSPSHPWSDPLPRRGATASERPRGSESAVPVRGCATDAGRAFHAWALYRHACPPRQVDYSRHLRIIGCISRLWIPVCTGMTKPHHTSSVAVGFLRPSDVIVARSTFFHSLRNPRVEPAATDARSAQIRPAALRSSHDDHDNEQHKQQQQQQSDDRRDAGASVDSQVYR